MAVLSKLKFLLENLFRARLTLWFLVAGEGLVFAGRNIRLLFTNSFYSCQWYNYVEFFHRETGKCEQKNRQKNSLKFNYKKKKTPAFSCWLQLLLVAERTLIRADFDRMLGNHFWIVNVHLNTFHAPKIYSFQNRYQNFSWWTPFLGYFPRGGQVRRECYLPERKMLLSRTSGVIFELWFADFFWCKSTMPTSAKTDLTFVKTKFLFEY